MTNSEIYKHGQHNRFSSTNQPAINGRKISQISLIRREFELECDWKISKDDAKKFLELLCFIPLFELKKLANNDFLPAVIINYIRALLKDIKVGRIDTAKDIIEFSFGKNFYKAGDAKKDEAVDLKKLEPETILNTIEYLAKLLDIEKLGKVIGLLNGILDKKTIT